jgi:alpha-glucosidase
MPLKLQHVCFATMIATVACAAGACAQPPATAAPPPQPGALTQAARLPQPAQLQQTAPLQQTAEGLTCMAGGTEVDLSAVETGVLRVLVEPGAIADARSPVLDPSFAAKPAGKLSIELKSNTGTVHTAGFSAQFDCTSGSLRVEDASGAAVLQADDIATDAVSGRLAVKMASADPIYGIEGVPRFGVETTLARPQGGEVKGWSQGNGGGPFFFTKRFGLLVDSVNGRFAVDGPTVTFDHGSRKNMEFFVMVGPPLTTMSALADLTGHAPMPPKWSLGFLNSQWGIDENELKTLVAHYRRVHDPLDGFIIDYDWKAWGEDDYGEWRWNSTPGGVAGDRFPDGASGVLGREMQAQGVYLSGILKPRILLYQPGSTTRMMQAAAYAQSHHFWFPGDERMADYASHQAAGVLDFSIPAARAWFWKHLEPAFHAGIVGWWPDEADELKDPPGVRKSSLEFFYIGETLYEGQRSVSDTRVWSLNRNYYLGAARFGYAEWSGDIHTGQASMAQQPARMLTILNLGEPHWSMDTGGFRGNPTPEEYARWVEFAALTPIARVHASHNQKRQPWVFGPVAEAAAKKALRLRYALMPYIYSAERNATDTGIGLVRPLEWIYPEDPQAAAQTNEWMFGDALLAAPVLDLGGKPRIVYLPAGEWRNWATGEAVSGEKSIVLSTDATTWQDMPLFVRAGSIVATEVPGDDLAAMKPLDITLDVFPDSQHPARWTMYDDDGDTYRYETGNSFRQDMTATMSLPGRVTVRFAAPQGTFATSVKTYVVRIHGTTAKSARWNGRKIGATASNDRFGHVEQVRIPAGISGHLEM